MHDRSLPSADRLDFAPPPAPAPCEGRRPVILLRLSDGAFYRGIVSHRVVSTRDVKQAAFFDAARPAPLEKVKRRLQRLGIDVEDVRSDIVIGRAT